MPVRSYFDEADNSILWIHASGNWTWEEYYAAIQDLVILAASVPHRVDQILDMRASRSIPREGALNNITRARQLNTPNMGITVIVGADRVVQALVNLLRSLYGSMYHPRYLADSIEEAQRLIQQSRARDNLHPE